MAQQNIAERVVRRLVPAGKPVFYAHPIDEACKAVMDAFPDHAQFTTLNSDVANLHDIPCPSVRVPINNGAGGTAYVSYTGVRKCAIFFVRARENAARLKTEQQQQAETAATAKAAEPDKWAGQRAKRPPAQARPDEEPERAPAPAPAPHGTESTTTTPPPTASKWDGMRAKRPPASASKDNGDDDDDDPPIVAPPRSQHFESSRRHGSAQASATPDMMQTVEAVVGSGGGGASKVVERNAHGRPSAASMTRHVPASQNGGMVMDEAGNVLGGQLQSEYTPPGGMGHKLTNEEREAYMRARAEEDAAMERDFQQQ